MNENMFICKDSRKENILKFYELVKDDLPKTHLIKTELICWGVKWTETKYLPNTITSTLYNMSRSIEIITYIYITLYKYIYIYIYNI